MISALCPSNSLEWSPSSIRRHARTGRPRRDGGYDHQPDFDKKKRCSVSRMNALQRGGVIPRNESPRGDGTRNNTRILWWCNPPKRITPRGRNAKQNANSVTDVPFPRGSPGDRLGRHASFVQMANGRCQVGQSRRLVIGESQQQSKAMRDKIGIDGQTKAGILRNMGLTEGSSKGACFSKP